MLWPPRAAHTPRPAAWQPPTNALSARQTRMRPADCLVAERDEQWQGSSWWDSFDLREVHYITVIVQMQHPFLYLLNGTDSDGPVRLHRIDVPASIVNALSIEG
jgi:hypothetical protein